MKKHVSSADEVSTLSALVHDRWIDLDQAAFYPERREFIVSIFTDRPMLASTTVGGELVVRQVLDCVVDDRAEIGTYDLNSVVYEDGSETLMIKSNFPMTIRLRVAAIDVSLEYADDRLS